MDMIRDITSHEYIAYFFLKNDTHNGRLLYVAEILICMNDAMTSRRDAAIMVWIQVIISKWPFENSKFQVGELPSGKHTKSY